MANAVCLRGLGNCSEAEKALREFAGSAGGNKAYQDAADKEFTTLAYIRQQLARPDSILIKAEKLNTANGNEKGLFAPVLMLLTQVV